VDGKVALELSGINQLLLIQCMMRMLGVTREALDDLVIMHLKLRSRTPLQVHMGSQ
jgi:hypothetical protein